MTTYLEFPRPYCLFTIQLLWAYDDDWGPFTGEIFIQERFWLKVLVRFGPNFRLWGIFQGLGINFGFWFPKRFDPCVRLRCPSHCV